MKTTGSKKTAIAWGTAIALLAAYELYALSNSDEKDTLSEGYWRASAKLPVVNFLFGFLAGHFAWQSADVYDSFRKEE